MKHFLRSMMITLVFVAIFAAGWGLGSLLNSLSF